ncbi:MAG TPA: tetratricopeptide repeat protein [Ktedonobacteraceae bacterium]|nr:tetratricopeptide repeat protein [Ktedonobacteraceae bacterium]
MAKKKQQTPRVSQEDTIQAQHIFAQYHQIATELHASTSRTQVEAALSPVSKLSEAAQIALLKMLAKEPHADAADLLLAINEASLIKEVRKEAKRSLIQLQGAKIYPQWSMPDEQPAPVEVASVGNAPRFWQGKVTDTRDSGEVQLILAFEQGEHYKEVRVLGFLLDFRHDGVQDCFIRIDSKRSFENFMNRMAMELIDVKMKNCSLAEGRRLLLDALAVNKKQGTLPYKDYRLNQSLINRLVLENDALDEEIENEDIEDEDADLDSNIDEEDEYEDEDEEPISLHDLSPDKVVTTFVESWFDGDFDIAYELLSSDSSLREGLSKEEWIERRDAWLEEADPGELEPTFLFELQQQKSKLWLPNPFAGGKALANKVIEAGWSVEMEETPLSETLPELPMATAVNQETERHWFWATFTLVQDQGEWRIQGMTDEAKKARERSLEELRASVQERFNSITDITKKHKPTDKDASQYAVEVIEHMMRAANYSDAIIHKLPDDPAAYKDILSIMFTLQFYERGLVYLEPFIRRFNEDRAINLRSMAAAQRMLGAKYAELEDDERGQRFLELAEQSLIESLSIEDNFDVRISLAEMLIEEGERLDEAEEHLHQASAFTTDPDEIAHIELHLGEIATVREQYEEAVQHYQRTVELQPDLADSWADLAVAYQNLDNLEEAEANYRHAIQLQPHNEDLYYALSAMFTKRKQPDKAIEVIKEGLSANPNSAIMNISLATMYLENDDIRQAELYMQQAERVDPDLPYIKMFNEMIKQVKQAQPPTLSSPKFSRQQQKKRK